jgi:hypothetical protein
MEMEYYSFEKVLRELQMEEDELKRLVSEGEIRAFRDEDKMKFRKSDIDGLKKGRMTEPTIILPSGESEEYSEDSEVVLVEDDTSETLLDIEDLDSGSSSTSVPNMDLAFSDAVSSSSAASETITEELNFEEESGSYVLDASDDVLIDSSEELTAVNDSQARGETFIDSDTGLETEPLDSLNDSQDFLGSDSVDAKAESGFSFAEDKKPYQPTSYTPEADNTVDNAPIAVYEEFQLSRGCMAALVASVVFMLFAGYCLFSAVHGSESAILAPMTNQVIKTGFLSPVHLRDKTGRLVERELEKHQKNRDRWHNGNRRY